MEALMTCPTPLANLIRIRIQELGLTEEALGRRLGYSNPAKAAGRVYALCNALPFSAKSRFALLRLPAALELPVEVVTQAVTDTERLFAEREREAEERRRLAAEQQADPKPRELQGPKGLEPTRYGDWERKGIISDF